MLLIYAPHHLPGQTADQQESERRIQSEIELEVRKEGARRMRGFFSPAVPDYDQRNHTEILEHRTKELRLQRRASEVNSDDSLG